MMDGSEAIAQQDSSISAVATYQGHDGDLLFADDESTRNEHRHSREFVVASSRFCKTCMGFDEVVALSGSANIARLSRQ